MGMTTTKLPAWKEVLKKFTHTLFEMGFRLDRFQRWVHPKGFTVWVGEKTWRYSSKGGSKTDSWSGLDIREEAKFNSTIKFIEQEIS